MTLLTATVTVERAGGAFDPEDVIEHGTDTTVTLSSDDMNKCHIHRNTAMCNVSVAATSEAEKGGLMEFHKRAAGTLRMNMPGSETVADSSAGGYIEAYEASETHAVLAMRLTAAGEWSVVRQVGSWRTG